MSAPSPRRPASEERRRDPRTRLGVRGGAAAALAVALAATLAPPAAGFAGPDELPKPTPELLAASVIQWDPAGTVIQWDPAGTVRSVEQVETAAGRTTITLATDILFTPDSAELPQTAAARVGELVAQVPQGAAVQVHGHTDSVQGAVDNQELSTARAEAVADVLRAGRPDLQLEVAGFAATRPAVTERADDPATRAANRRVEIVYAG
ncbi:OmpA family protein [Georgenia thermotolerans]|uniref:OmpA family protein n=1 Tax=Georgenia thermotolerans TaxID=527326 RepID=A0A7J5UP60_9MICO|nr:OmpA family protein [Georgenia thermotolerans]KAE8764117.1 OmpA family protein [Georgenia thermotolerans]